MIWNFEEFQFLPMWIQLWNIPAHWMSKETRLKIAAKLGRVLDIIIVKAGGKEGRCIKILLEIDIQKPLQRGTKLKFRQHENWVDFKYEQLSDLCFYCWLIGHNEKGCNKRKIDVAANCLIIGQYGMWL